jgi:ribosomal protein S18 acetylase RimI-like enzyme
LIRRKHVRKMVPVGKFTNLAAAVVGSWPPAPPVDADGNSVDLDLDHGHLDLAELSRTAPVLGFHYERRKGEGLVDGVPVDFENDDDAALCFRIVTDDGRVHSSVTELKRSALIALEIGSSRLVKLAAKMNEANSEPAASTVEIISASKAVPVKSTPFLIRLANFKDVPGIQALHQRGGFAPPSPRFLERVMVDENSMVIVAVDLEDHVVAWAKTNYIPASVAEPAGYYLTGVRVDDQHRRIGLAREMAAARLAWLRRRTDTVYASVPAPNQPARRYLSAVGFTEIPRATPRTSPTDSVLLELDFTDEAAL